MRENAIQQAEQRGPMFEVYRRRRLEGMRRYLERAES